MLLLAQSWRCWLIVSGDDLYFFWVLGARALIQIDSARILDGWSWVDLKQMHWNDWKIWNHHKLSEPWISFDWTTPRGFTVAFGLFASVAGLPVVHGSQSVMCMSFIVEGCTSAFDVVFLSILADLAKSTTDRVTCFSILYGMGAFGHAIALWLAAHILRWELQNYTLVWVAMTIAMSCIMMLVLLCIPESLPSAQAKLRPQKITMAKIMTGTAVQMRFLISNRFLQIWLSAVLLKSLAAGLGSIYASFTLAAYAWKPGDWQAVTWPFEMISMGSLSLLGPLAARKRPESVISFTSVAGPWLYSPNYPWCYNQMMS